MVKNKKRKCDKEIHTKFPGRWNKQVLQNKPISFRPTDNQLKFFKDLNFLSRSELIKKSIDFRKEFFSNPEQFFIKYGSKMRVDFQRANRTINRDGKRTRLINGNIYKH